MSRLDEWKERTASHSDEPWFGSQQAALPKLYEHSLFFERALDNPYFELFDLGHQLGVAYANPLTQKRWAVRIHPSDSTERLSAAVGELREKTA